MKKNGCNHQHEGGGKYSVLSTTPHEEEWLQQSGQVLFLSTTPHEEEWLQLKIHLDNQHKQHPFNHSS
jgi:hypothetical protein